jgi:SAM-dependent methyltransferase
MTSIGSSDADRAPAFKDHFSTQAADYARHRPRYPAALFAWLASLLARRDRAWDCATGSGQAAVALAAHVDEVVATDASASQVAHADAHPRVRYAVAPAERSGLADASVALVTVAQAFHWFDADAFWREVARVVRPGGVVALWSYANVVLGDTALQRGFDRFYDGTMGPYWPPERRLVEQGLGAVAMPFAEIVAPSFALEATWTLDDLVGYVGTWSATQRHRAATGSDPLPAFRAELAPAWGDPAAARTVRWPLSLRVGRVGDTV